MPFSKLGLPKPMVEGVKAMGYIDPTPIQLRAIPLILEGKDVIGSAQTGTGKTAAFALPILAKLAQHEPRIRSLILEPTRELAAQVETAIRDYARFGAGIGGTARSSRSWSASGRRSAGGMPFSRQIRSKRTSVAGRGRPPPS